MGKSPTPRFHADYKEHGSRPSLEKEGMGKFSPPLASVRQLALSEVEGFLLF